MPAAPPSSGRHYDDTFVQAELQDVREESAGWAALGMSRRAVTQRARSTINYRMYAARVPVRVSSGGQMAATAGTVEEIVAVRFSREDFLAALNSVNGMGASDSLRESILLVAPSDAEQYAALPPDAWDATLLEDEDRHTVEVRRWMQSSDASTWWTALDTRHTLIFIAIDLCGSYPTTFKSSAFQPSILHPTSREISNVGKFFGSRCSWTSRASL